MKRALLFTAIVFAQVGLRASDKNVGTSGAAFLKIGAGARSTAMGGAFVGVANDVNAVYYNPAGLVQLESPEMTAMHSDYFQDMNYDFGAFAIPTETGVFGFSASTLKIEDFEKRSLAEANEGSFDSVDAAYGFSYGRRLKDRLSLGMTARYIKQELADQNATAWAGDIGLFHTLMNKPISLGLAVRNMGTKIKFNEESDPLPLIVDAGASARLFQERLLLSVNLNKPRDNAVQFGLGTEWDQPLGEAIRVALRAGYDSTATDADGTTGISFGGGVTFKQFSLDMAWIPFGDLGNTMRYAVVMRF